MKGKSEQVDDQPVVQAVSRFKKEQFLKSRQRPGREKDILAVVLEEGKTYTIVEAEAAIKTFLKKEAK